MDIRANSDRLRGLTKAGKFTSHSATGSKFIDAVGNQLVTYIDGMREGQSTGRKPLFLSSTESLASEQIAIILLVTALDNLVKPISKQSLSYRVGQFLEQELNYDSMLQSNPGLFNALLKGSISHRVRRTLDDCVKNGALKAEVEWTREAKMSVGLAYVQALIEIGLLVEFQVPHTRGTLTQVGWSDMVKEWHQDTFEQWNFYNPVALPLVTKPLGYDSEGKEHSYGSAFPPVRFRLETCLFGDDGDGKGRAAADALSAVAYRIQPEVYRTMLTLWEKGISVGQLPSSNRQDIEPYPEGGTDAEIKDWKHRKHRIYLANAISNSRWMFTQRTLSVAGEYEGQPMHFLYQSDGRGRLYPLTATLINPQGSDLSKGLLEFYEPKVIGQVGLYYLHSTVAETWGKDKVAYSDRIQWVYDNRDMLAKVASDPIDTIKIWGEADEPWQFLAACIELAKANACSDPTQYQSRMIKNLDGRCSGAQHYTGLLRHRGTAESVGLVPSGYGDIPPDIYTKVLMKLIVLINTSDEDTARWWQGHFNNGFATRNLAKRPTMTYLYTATKMAYAQHIYQMAKEFGIEGEQVAIEAKADSSMDMVEQPATKSDLYKRCFYLANVMDEAIQSVMAASSAAMNWLSDAAKVITKTGAESIDWTAPSGFKVSQRYRKFTEGQAKIRCKIFDRAIDVRLKYQKPTTVVNTRKQTSALCANYVHSLDASHLVAVVLGVEGLDIRVIHDSFGVHLGHIEQLRYVLKDTFIEQYTPCVLSELKGAWEERYGCSLPDVPKLGDWMPEEMMDSVYDFS